MQAIRKEVEAAEAGDGKYYALERMLGEDRKDQPWNALTGGKYDRFVGKPENAKGGKKL